MQQCAVRGTAAAAAATHVIPDTNTQLRFGGQRSLPIVRDFASHVEYQTLQGEV